MKIILFTSITYLLISTAIGMLRTNLTGDVVLGGLFPIHRGTDDGQCGEIQEQDGIQSLETAIWTLQQLNDKYPRLKIGLFGMDTCESDTIALDNTLEFVSMDSVRISINPSQDGYVCRDGSFPYRNSSSGPVHMDNKAVGVVGAAFSQVSMAVAGFLRLFKIPQISYWSTSPELSDKDRFSFFKRTVPSDTFQARAIVSILLRLKWRFVVALYEQTNYGTNLYFETKRLAEAEGICFGMTEKIGLSKTDLTEELQEMAYKILQIKNTHDKVVVVLVTHYGLAKSLFEAVSRKTVGNTVYWVGVDAWAGRQFDKSLHKVVNGAIAVQPLARKLEGFDDYFTSLSPKTNNWNPWFREFWEFHFKCKFDITNNKDTVCTGQEKLSSANGYEQLSSLYYVRDAVTAFAYAIQEMHLSLCGIYYQGVCPNMSEKMTGQSLLEELDNIKFIDPLGYPFHFVNGTDGPPRYSVMMYTKVKNKLQWREIGNYTDSDEVYRFEMQTLPYKESVCSSDCEIGQERRLVVKDPCCWYCKDCYQNQYVSRDFTCETCAIGFAPNNFQNACIPLPDEFVSFEHPAAITACLLSSLGIIICIFVFVIYIKYKTTPVVKASGLELSFFLLLGIIISYVATFVFLAKPSSAICGLRRAFLGMCYTICYATILIKTNRIYRIFSMKDKANRTKMKRFTSSKSSLLITILLCVIEFAAIAVWLIFDTPKAINMDNKIGDKVRNFLVCHDSMDFSYLGVLIYPFFLMIVCIVYAVKTRKTPDGFNETKFITFCSSSTVIIWVAFIPAYFATTNSTLRVMSLTLSLFVNATVILSLLFLRKVYIVLFRPQKNTREKVMTRTSVSHDVDKDTSSHSHNISNRPVSAFSAIKNDEPEKKHKRVTGLKAELFRMHSEGFSISSPGIESSGMNLSASQIFAEISSPYKASEETIATSDIRTEHVEDADDSNTTTKHNGSHNMDNKNSNGAIPQIKINDEPFSTNTCQEHGNVC